jgi:two-component system OmpR family response regulator
MHLLLVEDDVRLARMLRGLLTDDLHVVEIADDGESAIELALDAPGIEAVILDVGLPGMSGYEVARRLRAGGSGVSILMLTARDAIGDRVTGLDAGADDYLVKPFAYEELTARLRALSRRAATSPNRPGPVMANGPIVLDEGMRTVAVAGRLVDLSPREFALLETFMSQPGRAMTRDELLNRAWPYGAFVTSNAVDAYVHYLRDRLGAAAGWIETVRGVGYRMRKA